MLTALLAAAVWSACFYFPSVWMLTGIGEADKLFLDLRNILAAGEAAQHGLDPYIKNPLDPYNRPHAYTEWWLVGGSLGLTLADARWLGPLLIGLTLTSTVLLLQPVDWKQGGLLFLVLVSPPLLLAINRANHDLVVFVIMCAALACLRVERTSLRALGVVLLAVSAALKYFPLAAVVILLDARTRRELVGWCLLYVLVLVLSWPALEPGLRIAFSHQPAPSWLYAFGAPVVFRDFELVAPVGWLLTGLLGLTAATSWPKVWAGRTASIEGDARNLERELACGAVMVVGCFLHGSSYAYKLIFTLWLLPWLWRASLSENEAFWRKLILGLLIAVLWLEGGLAVVINALFFAAVLPTPAAENLLKMTLLVSQLLTYAIVLCLWRALIIYIVRQLTRLVAASR